MGFKQRERKRMRKAAIASAQKQSRATGSASSRWWLTLATKKTCCARCARVLREGRELVYRASPRAALCLPCADRQRVKYRCSARWEQAHDRRADRPRR